MARMPPISERRASVYASGIPARQWPQFRRKLLAWFQQNKRDLPWRHERDPYRVWLSEIMLQQTRVIAAIPYYLRFLEKFPTLPHLARARESSVLSMWTGLGYYSRARNLHRAAREIVARHGGIFPREHHAALRLPGIGRYTAAAVLSIAYQEPLAALDGNVARVLARLGAVRGDVRTPKLWRKLDDEASVLLARETPGDWNEAMMELGATICTPAAPQCEQCPVARWCRGHAMGIADELPLARRKDAPKAITVAAAVLLDPRGRTLLLRYSDEGGAIFARLWQFPAVAARRDPHNAIRNHLLQLMRQPITPDTSTTALTMEPLAQARHAVTFRAIRLLPFLIRVPRLPSIKGARTPYLADLTPLPISGATRKIADIALRSV
jgi:A/G-specific adenine glycosylase